MLKGMSTGGCASSHTWPRSVSEPGPLGVLNACDMEYDTETRDADDIDTDTVNTAADTANHHTSHASDMGTHLRTGLLPHRLPPRRQSTSRRPQQDQYNTLWLCRAPQGTRG
jgi:hypothetical protein